MRIIVVVIIIIILTTRSPIRSMHLLPKQVWRGRVQLINLLFCMGLKVNAFISRKKPRLWVFENRVLYRIFGPKRE
jgi:hypothetical protein